MSEIHRYLPQYRWSPLAGFHTVEHNEGNVLRAPPKGVYLAVFNTYARIWEYGQSTGERVDHIWTIDHLPPEFRAGLLLMGVS